MKVFYEIDPRIKSKLSDLIDQPVTIRVTDFDEKSASEFAEDIADAHTTGQPIIPVIIDSYGGQVYSLLSMIAEIQASTIPIATIGVGKSMSCGSVLLSCGADGYRFMAPTSHLMVHDISGGKWGKIEELKSGIKQAEKLQKQIFQLMAKNCGHPANYFLDILHEKSHAEWFVSPSIAKQHNIINHIGMPSFRVSVDVDVAFEA